MKYILAIVLTLPLATGAKTKSPPALPDKDKIQILTTLMQNQDLIFKQEDLQSGCEKENLGTYLSRLIVFGSQGDIHSLEVHCEKYDDKKTPLPPSEKNSGLKNCRVSSFTSDKAGESPWHYELIFRISADLKTLDRTHFACPGTP